MTRYMSIKRVFSNFQLVELIKLYNPSLTKTVADSKEFTKRLEYVNYKLIKEFNTEKEACNYATQKGAQLIYYYNF